MTEDPDMTPREHPCDCDLTDDHGEAAELRRRLEARGAPEMEAEPVAWTGNGSLLALQDGREGFIFPAAAEAHPIPLYVHPQDAESLRGESVDKAEAWDAVAAKNARIAALKAERDRFHDCLMAVSGHLSLSHAESGPCDDPAQYTLVLEGLDTLYHHTEAERVEHSTARFKADAELQWQYDENVHRIAEQARLTAERDAALTRVAELEAAVAQKDALHKSALGVIATASAENEDLRAALRSCPVCTKSPRSDVNAEDRPNHHTEDSRCYHCANHRANSFRHVLPPNSICQVSRNLDDPVNRGVAICSRPVGEVMSQAARDVLAERQRQISAEGWTPEHDDQRDQGELAAAAATYALAAAACHVEPHWRTWPFQGHWWKPKDDRSDLVRSGALILAEVERLDRAALTEGGEG